MSLLVRFWKSESGSMVADLAKAAAAIAFLSVIAANFMSSRLDTDGMNQIAAAASKGKAIDPMITGSLQKRAGETKLDPCVVPR